VVITSERMLWEKMNYTHMNPVKAAYVEQPEAYRWSSARLVLQGDLSEESGLAYESVVGSLGTNSGGGI
jgi:hypothetical protein